MLYDKKSDCTIDAKQVMGSAKNMYQKARLIGYGEIWISKPHQGHTCDLVYDHQKLISLSKKSDVMG